MVIVRFRNQADWFKANWVFACFAEYVLPAIGDPVLRRAFEAGSDFGTLRLDRMEVAAARTLLKTIERVAVTTLDGGLDDLNARFAADASGYAMYLRAIEELLALTREDLAADEGA